jgi:hypothetical protein
MSPELFYKGLCGVLLVVIGFIGTQIYLKINETQKDIYELKILITKVQGETLTKEAVKDICIREIYHYHDTVHK